MRPDMSRPDTSPTLPASRGSVLLVDDDLQVLRGVGLLIEEAGYAVRGVPTPEEALAEVRDGSFDIMLVDLILPGADGIGVLSEALRIDENLVCVVITGHGSVPDAVRAMRSGAYDFVLKPFSRETLLPVLERSMGVRRLRLENIRLREAVMVYELSADAISSLDARIILEKTAEAALRQLGADEVAILTLSADALALELVVEKGRVRNLVGERVPLGTGIAAWAARHRELLVLEGPVDDYRFAPLYPREDILAAIVAPLVARDTLAGVLTANFTRSQRHFSPGQGKALMTLTNIAAAALHNAALLREVQQAEAEVRAANVELERRVAARTAELENANRELEAFVYSVSHDLRAPLRTIVSFSGMLLEESGGRLDPEPLDWLQRVRAASVRMDELIEALLTLSRIGRQHIHRAPVDLSAQARSIVEGLRDAEPDREVEAVIAPGVAADGDPALLRVVLENFLANAWKYTRGRADARIEFRAEPAAGGGIRYLVRDNGVGFEMADADRLFQPFQRLHSDPAFPGHGIGLATAARIVHRHGGEVRAEGEVGAGAVFSFTLGASQGAEP